MKAVLALLCIVGVAQATQFRQIGHCAEMCGNGCPTGFSCRSNGCGRSCVPDGSSLLTPEFLKSLMQAKRQIFGACVEMCSPSGSGGIGSCPAGYECKSNGCGHTCHKTSSLSHLNLIMQAKRQIFGACVEMCSPSGMGSGIGSCPAGYECKSNGCGHTCHKTSSLSLLNTKCQPVMCALYCAGGFATNKDGCPVCSCKSITSLKDLLSQQIV